MKINKQLFVLARTINRNFNTGIKETIFSSYDYCEVNI